MGLEASMLFDRDGSGFLGIDYKTSLGWPLVALLHSTLSSWRKLVRLTTLEKSCTKIDFLPTSDL